MCSRYTLTSPMEAVRSYFGHLNRPPLMPRYNIAPTQPAVIIRLSAKGERELTLVRWGLIPTWVKDPNSFATLVNARCETAAQKPSFRSALRYRRCLIPADGFYEWTGAKGNKQPHLIRARMPAPAQGTNQRPLLALAGIWEHWMGADGSEMETMAILTTEANRFMAPLHDRMPVMVQSPDFERWLDCKMGRAQDIEDLLKPAPEDLLEEIAVNRDLNNPRNEGPHLQEPVLLL